MFRHSKITDLIKEKGFLLSVELFPPRNGASPQVIFDKLERLRKLDIDFVSITKGAGGSHRGGTVPIGFMIGDRYGMEPLVHFRCRDLIKNEVENQLVDHIYFDIKNILAVLGDSTGGPGGPMLDPSHYNIYASELVAQIAHMRAGEYMPLPGEDGPRKGIGSDFCIGVAGYPDAADMEKELFVIREKVRAGADFVITQMVFDIGSYDRYVENVRNMGIEIPIIPGVRPLGRLKHLEAARDVFKAKLTPGLELLLDGGAGEDDRLGDRLLSSTLQLCCDLKDRGAPGVHLFILNDVDLAERTIAGLRERLGS